MEQNELKCKLEKVSEGMGYEVKKKFEEELNPIFNIFKLLIIFGFLTVFTIMGTFLSINLSRNNNIVYVDRIIYIDVNSSEVICGRK